MSSPKITKTLPKNLDVRTEGFTYSRTEGGKTLFTIRADTTLVSKTTGTHSKTSM